MKRTTMRRFLPPTVMLGIILFTSFVAKGAVDDTTTEVPFSIENGHVIVQARIKNSVPVEVLVSTGRQHSSIDIGLTKKYGLQEGYAGEPPVTGHNDRVYFFSVVPDVRVGEVKVSSLSMRLVSLSEISKAVGREIFGVIGADFFKGRVVQFDFNKKVLRFLSQSASDASKNKKAGTDKNGPIVLRMTGDTDQYENITVPVVEDVSFDGKRVKVLLDTGALMAVGISSSSAKKLGFTSPPEKSAPGSGKIGSVHLAAYELTDVPVVISSKGTTLDQELSGHGIVLGIAILKNFVVTFDFRSKIVVIEFI